MGRKKKIETASAGLDPEAEVKRRHFVKPHLGGPMDRPYLVTCNGYRCNLVDKFAEVEGQKLSMGCELYSRNCDDCDHYEKP